jgi:hypothetical protein
VAELKGLSPQPPACIGGDDQPPAYFVSARANIPAPGSAARVDDLAFTWSTWQRGIEPWRFNVPTSQDPAPDQRAHTVMDRTLLRAGETVSMKHLLRLETSRGFGIPERPEAWPATLVITHQGSGQQFTQPLVWRKTATGGLSAASSFQVPPAARWACTTWNCAPQAIRAAAFPAASAWRNSACRCSKAVSRPAASPRW